MINSVEEDGDNLKIKLKSGDIRMLTWNITTNLFSNVDLRRVMSLLGRTTLGEKEWRENLENLIIYRDKRKLKKKELSKKIIKRKKKEA